MDTWEECHEEEKDHDGHLDTLVDVVDKVTQGLDDMANEAGEWDNKDVDVEVVVVDEDAEHHQVVHDERLVAQNYLKQMKLC